MTPFFSSDRGSIYKAYAEDVYPLIAPGSVSLVISDGPYGMSKAAWDRMKPRDLPEWYGPHIEAWGEVCAPSATVYVWGTDEGEGYLRAPMRAAGWTFRGSIVWEKTGAHPARIGALNAGTWADTTERCGTYQRGPVRFQGDGSSLVWPLAATSYGPERAWAADPVPDRVSGALQRVSLHPCQKPLAFYDRIIRASSRPGELVLEPYGGTCRAAVACERLPAAEARRYVCIEPDEDGRDYLPAILPQLRYDPADDEVGMQRGLFQ